MSQQDSEVFDESRSRAIVKAIEERSFKAGGVQARIRARIRVLSVHPSLTSGDYGTEMTLRLAIRPVGKSKLNITRNGSLAARLSELGFVYSIQRDQDLSPQVDALVKTVRRDLRHVLYGECEGSTSAARDGSFEVKVEVASAVAAFSFFGFSVWYSFINDRAIPMWTNLGVSITALLAGSGWLWRLIRRFR